MIGKKVKYRNYPEVYVIIRIYEDNEHVHIESLETYKKFKTKITNLSFVRENR